MAISSNQALKHLRGHIGGQLVVRYYAKADRIVISAFPNMDKVVFSKAQLSNQNKFKSAIAFATQVKSSEMLSYLFKLALGNEISIYKEAIKAYFKNPESPLSFLTAIKMQGSPKEEPTLALPSCPQERLKVLVACLTNYAVRSSHPKNADRTRRHNPNHRKYPLLLAGKLASIY